MPVRIYVSIRSEAYVVIIHAWVHAVTLDEIYVISALEFISWHIFKFKSRSALKFMLWHVLQQYAIKRMSQSVS